MVSSPLYSRHEIFSNDMVRIKMHKSKLILDKPIYIGMTILHSNKILVYDVFHSELKNNTGQGAK